MQITVNRNELATAFAWAYKSVSKRPVVPVLTGILVEVGGALVLSAFDYESAHRAFVGNAGTADDVTKGKILVDASELKKIVAGLPKGKNVTTRLHADQYTLTVEAGGSTWMIKSIPAADEYPDLPPLPPLIGTADGAQFAKSVLRTAAAAGRDDTLPALLCVAFKPRADALDMEATDRYRLALDSLKWAAVDGGAELPNTVLVPAGFGGSYYASGVTTFAKGVKTGRVQVHYGLAEHGEAWVGFADNWHELIRRTSAGTWPNTGSVIPPESPVTLTADAAALAKAVYSAATMTAKNMPVLLSYADGTLTIQAQGDQGEITMTQAVKATADTASFKVGFNPQYLASMLDGFTGQVEIGLAGELLSKPKPAVIRSADDLFTAVVVPLRTNASANGNEAKDAT